MHELRWRGSRPACPPRSCARRASSSRCSATRRATSMSCSIRISVMLRVELQQQVGERHALAAREPRTRARRAASASARSRAPSPPRAGAAHRARVAPTSAAELASRPTTPASSRARSRISRSRLRAAHAQMARRASRARRGRGCPRRTGRGTGATSGRCGPMPSRVRPAARDLADVLAEELDLPDVCGMSPEITLNSVVLPAPLGPRIARRSPCATSRSTSRTASSPPNRRPTPRSGGSAGARS